MTATNHALTGALIGLVAGQPWVAVPTALASHFICDAIPHFGVTGNETAVIRSGGFRKYLGLEMVLCAALVAVLALAQPLYWQLAAICAFLAAAPDLLWINRYLKIRAHQRWRPSSFARFAGRIQWFQRPIGAAVEIAWFVAMVLLLVPFLLP